MKYLIFIIMVLSFNTWASPYMDLSAGVQNTWPNGDTQSYRNRQSISAETVIGFRKSRFDISLDLMYALGRQKDFNTNYSYESSQDDYNLQTILVGPTLKYHFFNSSNSWSIAPFIGLHYTNTIMQNSSELRYTSNNEEDSEDNEHKIWGYGGKAGLEFKSYKTSSDWIESINYKVYASYTKYKSSEGYYISSGNVSEYIGDTPDNLNNYTVGFMIGFSFGEKVINKTKQLISLAY